MYSTLTNKTQILGPRPQFLIQEVGEGPGICFLTSAQELLAPVFGKALLPALKGSLVLLPG